MTCIPLDDTRNRRPITMTTAQTETPPAPPTFHYGAYGVNLTWIGEEGGIVAEGHVPPRRFIAAANHMARTERGIRGLGDENAETVDDVLGAVTHIWALPAGNPWPDDPCDWYVRYDSTVTAETAGAVPVTLWEP